MRVSCQVSPDLSQFNVYRDEAIVASFPLIKAENCRRDLEEYVWVSHGDQTFYIDKQQFKNKFSIDENSESLLTQLFQEAVGSRSLQSPIIENLIQCYETSKIEYLEQLSDYSITMDEIPGALQDDRAFMEKAIELDSLNFEGASERLKGDKEFVLNAMAQDGFLLQHASLQLQDDPDVVRAAVGNSALALKFASKRWQDDEEIVRQAVSMSGNGLQFASNRLRNIKEICLQAVKGCADNYPFVPIAFQANAEFVIEAVMKNGGVIAYLSPEQQDNAEIAWYAVRNRGFALSYVSSRLAANEEIVLEAIKNDPSAYVYAANELKNNLLFNQKVVAVQPMSVPYFEKNMLKQYPELAMEFIKKNPSTISFMPKSLLAQSEFLCQACLISPDALPILRKFLKEDQISHLEKDLLTIISEKIKEHSLDPKEMSLIEDLMVQIQEYKNKDVRTFALDQLVQIFHKNPQGLATTFERMLQLDSTDAQLRKLQMCLFLIDTIGFPEEQSLRIQKKIIKNYKYFKDFLKTESFIFLLETFKDPKVKPHALVLESVLDLPDSERTDAMKLFITLTTLNPNKLDKLKKGDVEPQRLIELLLEDLQAAGFIPKISSPEQLKTSVEVFLGLRMPGALFNYTLYFGNNQAMKAAILKFTTNLLQGTFIQKRHEDNSHANFMSPHQLVYWQQDLEPVTYEFKGAKYLLVDTEQAEDLFLSGTEVPGSCQRVDADPAKNKCLMGYVLDGKVRMLAAKNKDKKIVARSIIKIMLKDDQPVLLFEKVYGVGEMRHQLLDLAIKKAQAMGVPLYESGNLERLESIGNVAPFEYEDEGLGVYPEGKFIIKARRVAIPMGI
jgi:hypothetical protein